MSSIRLKVAIHYDDLFVDVFGEQSRKKLDAIVAVADALLSEKKTLKTKLEIEINDISHEQGQRWEVDEWEIKESEKLECTKKCPMCDENTILKCLKENCKPPETMPKPNCDSVPPSGPPECVKTCTMECRKCTMEKCMNGGGTG